jgi:DNA-binding transcriptional LysR family regulator
MNRPIGEWQWDDVRFFLAAAREGSLSGAARVLGVGHVTVGRRLAFLEKRLAVKLLNRTPDGFAVTSAGQAILRQSAAMEAAALDLERAAAGRDLLAAGSVRITAAEALAYRIIVPAIASLRKSHPDLHVVVLAGVRSLDIARREADLAVRFVRPTASEVVFRSLGKVGFSLYASRRYIAEHGRPERGKGLGGHQLITFTGAPAATSPFFLGESMENARTAMQCDNPLIQMQAAREGIGIAELACFLGDQSELVRVWPSEPPLLRPVWLLVHQDLRSSTRVKLVSAAIADAFRRNAKILRDGQR